MSQPKKKETEKIDEISEQLLIKHAYMYEVAKILLNSSELEGYSEIEIRPETISENLKAAGFSPESIGPCITSLVVEKYLLWAVSENSLAMCLFVREKGMIAISTGHFLQLYEARQRDLLQAKLVQSSLDTNKFQERLGYATVFFTIVTSIYIGLTYHLQANDKSQQALEKINSALQETKEINKSTGTYLKQINSSIEKLKIDSFP